MADRLAPVVPAVDSAFDHVAQLAHIARPGVRFEFLRDMIGEARPAFPAEFGGHPAAEIIRQHTDITLAHAQGRQRDDLETEPVQQVGAKLAALRLAGQVLIGRGNDPDIDPHGPARTDPGNLAIFDRAQQPFLRAHRQCAQFVEK